MELVTLLPILVIFGALIFFNSRRQKKAMQATIELHDSLRIDDRVHTTAGLEATVKGITDDTVDLEIAPGVVTTWMKAAIRDRILPADEDDDDDEYEDDEYEDDDDAVADEPEVKVVTAGDETTSAIEAPSDPDGVKQASRKTDV